MDLSHCKNFKNIYVMQQIADMKASYFKAATFHEQKVFQAWRVLAWILLISISLVTVFLVFC